MKLTHSTRLTSICFAIVLFVTLSTVTSQCQAQFRRFVPGQELGRFLGAGYGIGYHCKNPGQNTDYYNPYSAHNSQLQSHNDPYGSSGPRYSDFEAAAVPHSSYNYNGGGTESGQHSVLEDLPGRSVRPTFEPAKDQTRKQDQEEDFDSSLDFDLESDDDAGGSGFRDSGGSAGSGSTSRRSSELQDAIDKLDEALEDEGDFDSLKDTFERLREGVGDADAFGDDS